MQLFVWHLEKVGYMVAKSGSNLNLAMDYSKLNAFNSVGSSILDSEMLQKSVETLI